MNCTNPKMKQLISLYQFDLLSEAQKTSVEAHLLECDACFAELYRLSPAMELINKKPDQFVSALQPRQTIFTNIFKLMKKFVCALKNTGLLILTTISKMWEIPAIKIIIPAAATIILAIFVLLPSSKQYSDLAILDKASYISFRLKGPAEITNTQKIFEKAMKFYAQDKYAEAIPMLLDFTKKEPDSAYGNFYLGVCLVLTDQLERGIEKLEISAKLCQQHELLILEERCYWYLGNAYLKINKVKEALIFFEKIIKLENVFEEDAREQVARIRERQQQ